MNTSDKKWYDRWQWVEYELNQDFKSKTFMLQIEESNEKGWFNQLGQIKLFKWFEQPSDGIVYDEPGLNEACAEAI